jgi:hypothetical protein
MRVSFIKYKKVLATIWFSGSGIVFILILLQTLGGKFSGQEEKAWGWFLPTVMPTLSLIIGVLVVEIKQGSATDKKEVSSFFYKLTMSLSIVYFVVLLMPVLIEPFISMRILELLVLSNLWLGPLQGLVTASVGVFFIKK